MKIASFSYIAATACLYLLAAGCAPHSVHFPDHRVAERLESVEYSVQAGAFYVVENAARMMRRLEGRGLDAYYFRDEDGFYKVRFGDFPDRESAEEKAASLAAKGYLREHFVVGPESYPAARAHKGREYVRSELVQTARSFKGTPYQWGGASESTGFDCSGLTMAVYRHNGLDLPRVAKRQYRAGDPVPPNALQKGDLVFFDTRDLGGPSHVGLYVGEGRFIHAPSQGSEVDTDRLSDPYFRNRFLGARTYL